MGQQGGDSRGRGRGDGWCGSWVIEEGKDGDGCDGLLVGEMVADGYKKLEIFERESSRVDGRRRWVAVWLESGSAREEWRATMVVCGLRCDARRRCWAGVVVHGDTVKVVHGDKLEIVYGDKEKGTDGQERA
ncbi:hypothetical protein AMTR_s00158p00045480 [Amborella trichopoda]|uniref:Uncharacterized protein n=1 Tax=Amborella trichopoda TaxID=13333 RepID=W1PSW5_AMBTC|nr:hypothetical protein AMTR_s00158p00045480 [Amborella trichopoda]